MRLLLQRVKEAQVEVAGTVVGAIQKGLLVFLGVCQQDDPTVIPYLVEKLCHLRVFSDSEGKMNLSLLDVQGGVLVVSQFTLYADCSQGRRPSFTASAKTSEAERLYEAFLQTLKVALEKTPCTLQTGAFGKEMQVSLTNDGPATFLLEKNP